MRGDPVGLGRHRRRPPFAYITNAGSSNVSVIDIATNTVVATVLVGGTPVAFGSFVGGQLRGVGDFDGDGKADVIWRNKVTGQKHCRGADTLSDT